MNSDHAAVAISLLAVAISAISLWQSTRIRKEDLESRVRLTAIEAVERLRILQIRIEGIAGYDGSFAARGMYHSGARAKFEQEYRSLAEKVMEAHTEGVELQVGLDRKSRRELVRALGTVAVLKSTVRTLEHRMGGLEAKLRGPQVLHPGRPDGGS